MARRGFAVNDHGRISADDDGCAVIFDGATDLITHPRDSLAVGISHARGFDHGPAVIGAVTQYDERTSHGVTTP